MHMHTGTRSVIAVGELGMRMWGSGFATLRGCCPARSISMPIRAPTHGVIPALSLSMWAKQFGEPRNSRAQKLTDLYRGTSPMRNIPPRRTLRSPMPMDLW